MANHLKSTDSVNENGNSMLLAKLRLPLLGLLSALALSGASGLTPKPAVTLAAGSPEATPTTQTVHLGNLGPLPTLVQHALDGLQQQNGPDFVADVTSVEVKYVTETQLFDAIHGAWKHNNAAECNTFTGPSGSLGHVYAVVMHGKFSYLDYAGGPVANSYPVEVILVHASDFQWDLTIPRDLPQIPGQPPMTVPDITSPEMLGNPFLGPDGEPLCWGSLPSE